MTSGLSSCLPSCPLILCQLNIKVKWSTLKTVSRNRIKDLKHFYSYKKVVTKGKF